MLFIWCFCLFCSLLILFISILFLHIFLLKNLLKLLLLTKLLFIHIEFIQELFIFLTTDESLYFVLFVLLILIFPVKQTDQTSFLQTTILNKRFPLIFYPILAKLIHNQQLKLQNSHLHFTKGSWRGKCHQDNFVIFLYEIDYILQDLLSCPYTNLQIHPFLY